MAALLCLPPAAARDAAAGEAASPWFMSFYGGQLLDERLNRILRLRASTRDFRRSWAAGVGLGREVARLADPLRLEVEGQLVQHVGRQAHTEGVAVAVARWTRFPWDPLIDTSLAVGEGLSLASRRPPMENADETGRLLNYLMLEVELGPVPDSPWRIVGRIHHRSGIFGAFGGVEGGSNIIMLGLRFRP